MALRLEPADEFTHTLGPEPNFNESMYVNTYDADTGIGLFLRLGNRANEGLAEMTVCIYLPNGQVAFLYDRPSIEHNDAFDAGGMRFLVVEPFEHLEVTFTGEVLVLEDPKLLADPRRAFTESRRVPCAVELDLRRISTVFGGEPDEPHEVGEEFARGHYEQLVTATGSLRLDGTTHSIAGSGLRDHSWGPRSWQAPYYYRWLTGTVGDDFGFMGSRIARRDGDGTRGGFVWEAGRLLLCDDIRIISDWDADDMHRGLQVELSAWVDGSRRAWSIRGEVLTLVPLRNRRDGAVTRISEGLTRWTVEGVGVGHGWSEYLDQIQDGRPVGLAE